MREVHTLRSNHADKRIAHFHAHIITELKESVQKEDVLVVGMALNPHVRKVRNLLKTNNINYTYKEVGGYFSQWKKRLAIKMWSGWPTFPQVFVRGRLIGGASDTALALQQGDLQTWLKDE